jgi:hypothetical protein
MRPALAALFVSFAGVPILAQDATAPPLPVPTVIEEAADAEFNLEIPLTLAGETANATAAIRFDEQANGDRVELRLKRDEMSFAEVTQSGDRPIASLALTAEVVAANGKLVVTLRRRLDGADILMGGRSFLVIRQEATPGKLSFVAPAGVVDQENLYYQPYAPPEFSDDFMRDEPTAMGEWQVVAGTWENTILVDNPRFIPKSANSFALVAHAETPSLAKAGDAFWDDYECAVSARLPGPGTAGLAFRVHDAANAYLYTVTFGAPGANGHAVLKLVRLAGGSPTVLAERERPLAPGQWYRLRANAAGARIDAFLDDVPVLSAEDDAFAEGPMGLYAADAQTIFFDDAEARELKGFSDDFEDGNLGPWQVVSGDWQVGPAGKAGGQVLTKKGEEAGLAVTGRPTWTDYELRAQFRPGGVFGLCFLWTGPGDTWLWRCRGGRQQLVQVVGGTETVVDEGPLEVSQKDWSVVVIRAMADYARVTVNDSQTLEGLLPAGLAGKVGVWADRGSRPFFDNVSVTFPPAYAPANLPATMETDAEMKEQFANPAEGWFQVGSESTRPQAVGMNWNKGEYFEPVDIEFPVAGVGTAAGKVTVTLEGDQTAPGHGLDLVLTAEANSPKLHLDLRRDGQPIAQGDTEVDPAAGTCLVHVSRKGSFILAYINQKPVITYREGRAEAPTPTKPAEQTEGQSTTDE